VIFNDSIAIVLKNMRKSPVNERNLTEGLKHDFILASISFGFGGRIRTHTVTLLSPVEAFKSVFLFFPEEGFPEGFKEIGNEVDLLKRRSPEPLLIFQISKNRSRDG
jgi:hypothetical protein